MSIERLGPVDPLSAYNKSQKVSRTEHTQQGDSIRVSEEARAKAELLRIAEATKTADDVRTEKVEEAKRKLADPSYINDEVLSKTADSILNIFGI